MICSTVAHLGRTQIRPQGLLDFQNGDDIREDPGDEVGTHPSPKHSIFSLTKLTGNKLAPGLLRAKCSSPWLGVGGGG